MSKDGTIFLPVNPEPISIASLEKHKFIPDRVLMHEDTWRQFLEDELLCRRAVPANLLEPGTSLDEKDPEP